MSEARGRALSLAADAGDLVEAVVRFCRLLRAWGVQLPASASQCALEALREIDVTRREDFRNALRIAIVQRPEDFPLFTYLFNAYWRHDDWRKRGLRTRISRTGRWTATSSAGTWRTRTRACARGASSRSAGRSVPVATWRPETSRS